MISFSSLQRRCRNSKNKYKKKLPHTSLWVHAEHAMLVPADDAVSDLAVGVGVSAGCVHSERLSTHGHILRHGGCVFTVLKHRRIVVDVQDGDHHLAERGQTRRALVTGTGLQLIYWLHFAVQGTLQGYYTSGLVNWEKSISGLNQWVEDVAIQAWGDKKDDAFLKNCITMAITPISHHTTLLSYNSFELMLLSLPHIWADEPNATHHKTDGHIKRNTLKWRT